MEDQEAEEEGKGFVLKLKSSTHDETLHTQDLRQHGGCIILMGVYGRAVRRERLLGYLLAYTGLPIIHASSWYVGLAYSEEEDIRRKTPELILADNHVRLWVAGIGNFDYLFSLKRRTDEHDDADLSDAAAHRESADQWRDGM